VAYSVAIVDDERVVREGMADLVAGGREGFILAGVAANGREGLELVLSAKPSFVVTDIRMPKMDGLQMVEELRRREVDVRVAIVTGYDDSAYARTALRFGVKDYLLKPVRPEAFRELLKSVKDDLDREALKLRSFDELRARAEAALPAARERRVRDLLEGKAHPDGEADGLLGLDFSGTACCAALLKVARKSGPALASLADAAAEAFGPWLEAYPAPVTDDTLGFALVGRSGDGRRAHLAAASGGKRLRDAAERAFGAPATFSLGGVRPGADGLPASFAEAREALSGVFGSGEGRVVAYGDLSAPLREPEPAAADSAESAAVAAVKLGAPEEARAALGELVKSRFARYGSMREESVKARVISCLSAVDLALPHELDRPDPPVVRAAAAASVAELADIAGEYAAAAAAALERFRAGRAADLVERSRIVAERRMADEALVLDDIAAELYVSPSHLRHVFKARTGMTFCDYLSSLRLDAAARLLEDPDLKIQDVARMVGYAEQRYFASCFKKRFGMTPSERRERRNDDASIR
jgi:two-component system response regulator YesN